MLSTKRFETSALRIGMFVSGLDRPWLETPFPLQGFQIKSTKDIDKLRKYCSYVHVDLDKSELAPIQLKSGGPLPRKRLSIAEILPGRDLTTYADQATLEDEAPQARAAVDGLSENLIDIFTSARRGGAIDMVRIKRSVRPVVDSVSRNPDACLWLAQMKRKDGYIYQHSLAASVWAIALGRQLGLPRQDLNSLAIGGLLFDIGKLKLDTDLLVAERSLTEEEQKTIRSHVQLGAEIIDGMRVSSDVRDMVLYHHERHDGSGYPNGLKGNTIPVFARIAGLVDVFDAITSHRGYAEAVSAATAIKYLHESKDVHFQAELVEEFIQAIGIYPAGTLVELSSGQVAVVIAECRIRRLRPKLLVILDEDKQPLKDVCALDLMETTHDKGGEPLNIVASLPPGAYDIDMTGLNP